MDISSAISELHHPRRPVPSMRRLKVFKGIETEVGDSMRDGKFGELSYADQ